MRLAAALTVACLLGLGFCRLPADPARTSHAVFAQELLLRAWGAEPDRWPWRDTRPVARLRAQGGAIDLVVLDESSEGAFVFGPAHLEASVLPGENGNAVIAGQSQSHFRFLADLAIGQRLLIERSDGQELEFEIVHLDVVDSRRASLVLDSDVPMLTLITTWPFGGETELRPMHYVVAARGLK